MATIYGKVSEKEKKGTLEKDVRSLYQAAKDHHPLETFSELSFRRFLGSFEPIFDSRAEGNIDQNNPKNATKP